MNITTKFNCGEVLGTRSDFKPGDPDRLPVEAATVEEMEVTVISGCGEMIRYRFSDGGPLYFEYELQVVDCPCGTELTGADVRRDARDSLKRLICEDCATALEEKAAARDDGQEDEGDAEFDSFQQIFSTAVDIANRR